MNTAIGLILARSWMNICGILSFLVVARFVTPAEIGSYALASSTILLPMSLVGAGYVEHVISRDPDGRDTATAFWSAVATGACGTLLGFAAAYGAHALLEQQQIALIIALMAPLPLIWSVAVVPEATLIRDGRGGVLATVPFVADTLAMVALVVVLLLGGGAVALAVNRVVSCVVMFAGVLLTARLPPRLWHFDVPAAKRIGWFSLGVAGSRLAGWANQFGTDLTIGIVLSTTAVGYFRMASRLAGALYSIVWQGPSSAQLAYFGRWAAAPYKAYLRALRLHASLVTPVLVGAAVAAPVLLDVLLGPAWRPSALVFSLMCIGDLPGLAAGVASNVLIARGRSHRAFMIHTTTALATVAGMTVGAHFGLAGTAIARVLVTCIFLCVTVAAVSELRPSGLRRTLLVLGSASVAGAAMAVGMAAVMALWPAPTETVLSVLRITVAGLAGLAAYAATTLLVLRPTALLLRVAFMKRWGRRGRPGRRFGRRGWRFGFLSS